MTEKKRLFQIVYQADPEDLLQVALPWRDEAKAMRDAGILVGLQPHRDATELLWRGFCIHEEWEYPRDPRYIGSFATSIPYRTLSVYYPLIADLSIETFFVDQLGDEVIEGCRERGWTEAFIKKEGRALENVEEGMSIWPHHSFEEMMEYYRHIPGDKYGIRKVMDSKYILENDARYWVLNGHVYRRDNLPIPDVVYMAAERLNTLGSRYYTIDATPDFVIEVNPGESSDRHGENSAELFASWFAKEFNS